MSDRFGAGPGEAGVDSKGVCLLHDLCMTRKLLRADLSEDLWLNTSIGDVVAFIPFLFWPLLLIIYIPVLILSRLIPPATDAHAVALFQTLMVGTSLCSSVNLHMICLLSSAMLTRQHSLNRPHIRQEAHTCSAAAQS